MNSQVVNMFSMSIIEIFPFCLTGVCLSSLPLTSEWRMCFLFGSCVCLLAESCKNLLCVLVSQFWKQVVRFRKIPGCRHFSKERVLYFRFIRAKQIWEGKVRGSICI